MKPSRRRRAPDARERAAIEGPRGPLRFAADGRRRRDLSGGGLRRGQGPRFRAVARLVPPPSTKCFWARARGPASAVWSRSTAATRRLPSCATRWPRANRRRPRKDGATFPEGPARAAFQSSGRARHASKETSRPGHAGLENGQASSIQARAARWSASSSPFASSSARTHSVTLQSWPRLRGRHDVDAAQAAFLARRRRGVGEGGAQAEFALVPRQVDQILPPA